MTVYSLTFIFQGDDDGEERTLTARKELITMAGAACTAALNKLTGLRVVALDIQSLDTLPEWVPRDPRLN